MAAARWLVQRPFRLSRPTSLSRVSPSTFEQTSPVLDFNSYQSLTAFDPGTYVVRVDPGYQSTSFSFASGDEAGTSTYSSVPPSGSTPGKCLPLTNSPHPSTIRDQQNALLEALLNNQPGTYYVVITPGVIRTTSYASGSEAGTTILTTVPASESAPGKSDVDSLSSLGHADISDLRDCPRCRDSRLHGYNFLRIRYCCRNYNYQHSPTKRL